MWRISGPSLSEETVKLAELRAQHLGWTIWKDRHTGSWWACPPPPGMTLLDAPDLDRLEGKILDVEAWGGTVIPTMANAEAVRVFAENERVRLGRRIAQIKVEVQAGNLTPSEVFTAMALAYEDHEDGAGQVWLAFTASARRFLATLTVTPATPSPLLFQYAAKIREYLAALLAAEPGQ
jgi:hypothetical protein